MLRNITLEKVVRWIIGLTLASAAIWVLVNYSNLLAYSIISIFIAYLLDPLVSWAESKGANRTLAISITLIAFPGLVVWASY
ncbi:MAG: AI-2E family transporter, partial [Bacteroidetes bacterium]|nr:AI-2E family transporter [Bacteroidota bacterium]